MSQDMTEGLLRQAFGNLPSEQTQSDFTGLSKQQAFIQALAYLDLCKWKVIEPPRPLNRRNVNLVLDFGC
jgi:hypothetical protein